MGTGIKFSSDSRTLQLFFKCHCMGLICRWTCVSVAVSRPMRDMNFWTGHTGPGQYCVNFVYQGLPTLWCGSDLALFQVELVTYEVEKLLWIQF